MRKVTTINLNNNAYQIDEDGYEALRAYLERAERALANNPDRAEILSDLEQAIADKCRLALGPYKTVVSSAEIDRILKEMGPVAASGEDTAAAGGTGAAPGGQASSGPSMGTAPRQRRLYRIVEGQKWTGVCNGLAAWAGVDVGLVRVAFILLTIFTGGFWFVAYLALVFVLPIASTPEELAAAYGQPFNAQELVDRVKKKHDDFRAERRARRAMRRQARWWSPPPPPPPSATPHLAPGYAARVTGGVLLPVLTVISAVWFTVMAIAMASLWWTHGYASWGWPHGGWHGHGEANFPRWLAIAAVLAVYALIAIPISAGRRAALYYANGGRLHGWADAWSGLLWVALVAVLLLVAWNQLPQLQDLWQYLTHSRITTTVAL